MTVDFEVTPPNKFDENEIDQAKNHWSGVEIKFYTKKQIWSEFIAARILACGPASVFEFGCNAGKNLTEICERNQTVHASGIDINKSAISYGREAGLNLAVGDESCLDIFPDNCFDVTFTVSVIDHIPYPAPILTNLLRISRKAVLMLEPWLGEEGKVTRNRDRKSRELIDTTPFSYSWDYVALAHELAPGWDLVSEDYKIDTNIGRYYQLFTLTPK
jgi:SAM-dependent methyltransferase